MPRVGLHYASPLNWIQIGSELLVPPFDVMEARDVVHTRRQLAAHGFRAHYISARQKNLWVKFDLIRVLDV